MKRITIISVIFLMIIALTTVSMAAEGDSFILSLEPVSSELTRGETFEVRIFLDNIQVVSGEQGIAGYTARITYDENILSLEKVSASSGWEAMENEGAVVVNTSNAEVVKDRTETIVVTFRVNDNASIGNTTIGIENIEGTSIAETIEGTGSTATIRIAEEQTPGDDNNQTGNDNQTGNQNQTGNDNQTGNQNQAGNNNQVGNNNQTNNDNTSGNNQAGTSGNTSNNSGRQNTVINSTSGDNTQKYQGSLPYAGIQGYIGIAVVIVLIVSGIFYYNYRKYRKI